MIQSNFYLCRCSIGVSVSAVNFITLLDLKIALNMSNYQFMYKSIDFPR